MKFATFFLALSTALLPAGEQLKLAPQPEVDLSGFYECFGKDISGVKYSGVCHVVRKAQIHVVTWLTGGNATSGVGIVTHIGDKSVFSVSWAMNKEGQVVRGVNAYVVSRKDGHLHMIGRWSTIPGNGQQNHETLKWLKESGKDDE